MIRCAWRYDGEGACQEEAEVVTDGTALCVAHAMHRDWLKFKRWQEEFDASMKAFERSMEWDLERARSDREAINEMFGRAQADTAIPDHRPKPWRWPWQRKQADS